MGTEWFTYYYGEAEISRWKEIIAKTMSCSIKHGFKPGYIEGPEKRFYWKSLEDLIKEIERKFSKYRDSVIRIGGLFGDYGLEAWPGYSLEIIFFLGPVKEKDVISLAVESDDERWLKSGDNAKKDFNNFLKDLGSVLGLKVIEYQTEDKKAVKINEKGFIL